MRRRLIIPLDVLIAHTAAPSFSRMLQLLILRTRNLRRPGQMGTNDLQQLAEDLGAASQHIAVAHVRIIAFHVTNQAPCLGNQQATGRHIPR